MKNILFLILLNFFVGFNTYAQVDDSKLLDLIESQRYNDVATYLESVYPSGSNDPKVISRLAYAYYMSGNLVKAESNYLSLLQKDSTKISTLNNLASIANKRGNYPQMINFYSKILAVDSTNFYIIKQIAYSYQQLDNDTLSFDFFEKANKINPTDAEVAYDLSKIYMSNLLFDKSIKVLNPALEADSTNLLLLRSLLKLNGMLNKFPEMVKAGELLIRLGDTSNETYNQLAQAYYYTNNYKKCIEYNEKIISGKAETETTFYFMGLGYRKLNNLEKSNEFLNKAVAKSISENISIYYQELGTNREETKQFTSSIYNYKKALEFSGDVESVNIVNYSMARIYDAELKSSKTAVKFYKEYVKNANPKKKSEIPYIEYSKARVKEITLSK
jgi:tetratricopeptide (TPR) repeat protein